MLTFVNQKNSRKINQRRPFLVCFSYFYCNYYSEHPIPLSQALPQHWGVHPLWSADPQWDQGSWRSQSQLLSGGHLLPWWWERLQINVCFFAWCLDMRGEPWQTRESRIHKSAKLKSHNEHSKSAVRSEAKPKMILASQSPDSFMQLTVDPFYSLKVPKKRSVF